MTRVASTSGAEITGGANTPDLAQQLAALHEVGQALAARTALPELLQLVVNRVVELSQAAGGGLCRYRPELDRLEWVATSGQGEALNGRLIERDQGVAGRVWAAGQSLLLPEETETRPGETWPSAAAVPIRWGEHFLGVLLVFSFTAGAFSQEDLHLLERFATQAAGALENERLVHAEQATREMAQSQTNELRARHRYLTLLNEITLTALESPDLGAMLRFMSERLVEVVDANYCYITLWDDQEYQAIPTAATGDNENRYPTVQIEPQELTATASLYRHRRPLVIPDPYNSPYISPSVVARFPIKSLLALPMLAGEQFLGAVLLAYDEPHYFTQSEIEQGVQAARQVALAVVRVQLLQTEREQRLQAETLTEVTLALTAQTEPNTVLDEILYQAQRIVPYSSANITLFDGRQLTVVRSRGYERFDCRPFMDSLVQLLVDIPLERPAITEGQPFILSDTSEEPAWHAYAETAWVRSFMSLPMRLRERTIGLLRMDSDRPGQFTEEDARRLQPLVNAAAIAIENANLLEETRRRNAELTILNRISEVMLTTHSLRSAFEQIAAAISQLTDFPIVTLEEYDRTRQLMVYWGAVGLQYPAVNETLEVSVDESLSGQVVRSGKVLVEAHHRGRGHAHPLLQQLQVQTYIGIPLQASGRIIGVLSLASPEVVHTDDPLLSRLTNIANYLAALVERRQVEEAMRHTQRLESLGVMAGGVAHDFNNLLSSILMHSSLALRKMEPETAARHNLQQVIKTTRRAAELTHQLLAYTGKGHIEVQALDLNRLIQENVALLEMSIPRNVTLKAECTPNLPVVQGDAGQMQQLIMNLVINAAEAYGERSGTVWVRTLLGQVDHVPPPGREWQPGAYVCLIVEDQGAGMDEHTLDHIFDPFFTTKFTGRGLGLAAVSGIVQGHRGHISVSSTPGKGTSFCVFLPAQARPVQTDEPLPEEPAAPAERAARPGTILIVDDEVILRDGLTEYLALHGYRTLVADNGEAGLALMRQYGRQIDLIVLDMTMPVMSGRETLTAFQQLALDVPVFLISGYDETTIVEGIADTMVIDFLQKPFRAETFLARVQELLNRRRN